MTSPGIENLRARFVYPVDAPPIENGCVAIVEDRIVGVIAANRADGKVTDLGDVALMPGLVNAHTHLEFSQLPRPLAEPGTSFVDWIRAAISHRRRRSYRPAAAIAVGLAESLAAGVTTLGEIATADAGAYRTSRPAPRATIFREVIGFSLARDESAYAAASAELEALERLVDGRRGSRLGLSPHAPYTVSLKLLERLTQLANLRQMPLAMHIAESREELDLLRDGSGPFRDLLEERSMWDNQAIPPGSRPLDYLRTLAQGPRGLVVHGNYLADDELEFLADQRRKLSLVHCPRTHSYFGHARLPLASLLDRGVRVALGTDGRGSNPDLSIWAEMADLAAHHADVAPSAVLRMGTLSAAEALGCEAEVGSITVGKLADLVAMPLVSSAAGGPGEGLAALLTSASSPSHVWLGGELISNDQEHD